MLSVLGNAEKLFLKKQFWVAFIFAANSLFCYAPSAMASPASLIREGNRAFASGNFDAAVTAYDKASLDIPESAEVYFNKAAVEYQKGNFVKAAEVFETAAMKSKDLKLEALSKLNRGNSMFSESERQRDSDLEKSLEFLKNSILDYQQALKLDPEQKEAAFNLEVSRMVMKQVLDEINKKKEEEKKKQEEQQRIAEELKKLYERQESLAKKTREVNAADFARLAPEMAQEQTNINFDTEKFKAELDRKQEPSLEKAKEHITNALGKQKEASESLAASEQDTSSSRAGQAAEELKKALDSLAGDNKEKQCNNPGQDKSGQEKKEEGQQEKEQQKKENKEQGQSKSEASKPEEATKAKNETAKDILAEEDKNREERQRESQTGNLAVDKDW